MKAILDTHAFLWWILDDPRLSQAAREIMGDEENTLFVSAASAWEMLIAVAVMAGMLPPAAKFEKVEELGGDVTVRWFGTPGGRVGIAWSSGDAPRAIPLPAGARMLDLMGNALPAREPVGAAPVHIVLRR